jgi:predicted nucleic acid-binding protein
MVLVDTSVWIEAQRPQPRDKGLLLRDWVAAGIPVCITPTIYQEILQGARDAEHFHRIRLQFSAQRVVVPADARTHIAAARLYAECRWRGVTVRKSTDCLIAQIAIEHELTLLHDDDDFVAIARVEPRLKLA